MDKPHLDYLWTSTASISENFVEMQRPQAPASIPKGCRGDTWPALAFLTLGHLDRIPVELLGWSTVAGLPPPKWPTPKGWQNWETWRWQQIVN